MWLLALATPRALFWLAILGLCIALGAQTLRLDHVRAAVAEEHAALEKAARQHADEVSRIQAGHAAATQALADAYEADRARLADDNARLSADAGSLRADIERYAAGAAGATADAASCQRERNRARTLGQLFGDADSLAEKLARAAEQRNAEVNVLKRQILADRSACDVRR